MKQAAPPAVKLSEQSIGEAATAAVRDLELDVLVKQVSAGRK